MGRPYLETFTYTLVAGQSEAFAFTGQFVRCLSATGSFDLFIDGGGETNFGPGRRYRTPQGETFKRLRFVDTSGAPNTITFAVGYGDLADDSITLSGAIDVSANAGFVSSPDVSLLAAATTLILAADPNRREAIISNLAANTQTFRVGDAGAAAAEGIPLAPGATLILSTTGEIRGYNPGAGAESVAAAVVNKT